MWKYIFSTDKLYLYVLNAHPFVSNMSKNKQKLYVVIIILRLQNIKP